MIGGPSGGDAESRRYYEVIRSQTEALPNLTFLGFVHPTDVEQHFERARIFVNTSDAEGFPNTFLQAWSRSMPTVSLFDPNSEEEGLPVCSAVKEIKEMVEVLRKLNRDDVYWRETGERCRQHFTRCHSLSSVLDHYEMVFQNLLGGAR